MEGSAMEDEWIPRRKPMTRAVRARMAVDEALAAEQTARDDDTAREEQQEEEEEPVTRPRVHFMPSDSSGSESQDEHDAANNDDDDDDGDEGLARLLRDDDSSDGSNSPGDNDDGNGGRANEWRNVLGLDEDDDEGLPVGLRRGQFVARPLIGLGGRARALRFALPGAGERAAGGIVDLQEPEAQEIDLTALPSDSEDDTHRAQEDDDDDEVEIVGTTAPPIQPLANMQLVSGRSRKRRRTSEGGEDGTARESAFNTQRAESTNISLENNETIERFKAALKCSVCLEVIEDMTSTICGHVYCAKCIRLAIRVTHKCPLCQRPLRPTDIHGLFF